MTELRCTSPDQTPNYYDSSASDLEAELKRLSSGVPATKTVSLTLPQAMQMVLDGKMQPGELYQQLPLPLKSFFDETASQLQDKTFQQLPLAMQKQLIRTALEVTNQATDSPAVPTQTQRKSRSQAANATKQSARQTATGPTDRKRRRRFWFRLAISVVLIAGLAATAYWFLPTGGTSTDESSRAGAKPTSAQPSQAAPQQDLAQANQPTVATETQPTRSTEKWIERTWTDVNGRRVEAALVGYRRGQIELMIGNGVVNPIATSKLCQADRVFLWQLASEKLGPFPLFETRVWTAAKDSSEVVAAVIGIEEDSVQMMRSDGRCFNARRESLSTADQSYLSSLAEAW